MGNFCLRRQMFGVPAQIFVIGQQRTTAPRCDGLITVKAQCGNPAKVSCMTTFVEGADGFRRIFHEREMIFLCNCSQRIKIDGMPKGVHGKEDRYPASRRFVEGVSIP